MPIAMDAEYARYLDSRIKEIASRIDVGTGSTEAVGKATESRDKSSLEQKLRDAPDDFFANLHMGALLQNEGDSRSGSLSEKGAEAFPPVCGTG